MSADKPTYSQAQMYGAPRHFAREQCAQFLRGHCASVLPVSQPRTLSVNVGTFAGPPQLGEPAHPRPLRFFNPSLTAAPHGLCPRCVYVVAVRADVLHQCDASSPLFNATWKKMTIATAAFFKGTVLLVLDREMAVLDWTWLITRPPLQIATWADHGREYVPAGVSGGFTPPWSQQVYDARLLNLDGRHLLVTYNCAACTFSVSPVHLERKLTADGGLHMLQAWTPQRIQVWDKWLQGRNQALFVAPDMTGASGLSVLIQPWLGIIGSLGAPSFKTLSVPECYGPQYLAMPINRRREARWTCGLAAPNGSVQISYIANLREFAVTPASLVLIDGNTSLLEELLERSLPSPSSKRRGKRYVERQEARHDARHLRKPARAAVHLSSSLDKGGSAVGLAVRDARISATANLVLIQNGSCTAFLGIGHLHRGWGGEGKANNAAAFKFGSRYTHFWYTTSTAAPYRMLSSSAEFCLQSSQDPKDCESVQFLSGLHTPRERPDTLLISYGVNDCEARIAEVLLDRVWGMLMPLDGKTAVCDHGASGGREVPVTTVPHLTGKAGLLPGSG